MLSQKSLRQLSLELQTSELNVGREYLQHLFLSYLYQHPQSDSLAFKGGTALRLLFGSPRFSEDLDFSSNASGYHIAQILEKTRSSIDKESIASAEDEAKTTSGGYFARYLFHLHDQRISIELNISLREKVALQPALVTSLFIPAYQCLVLAEKKLVREKIDALLRRKKPRDFFDLYFLLRNRRGIEEIVQHKKDLLPLIESLDARFLRKELRLFLPTTQHGLLKDFRGLLWNELKRL